MEKIERKIEKKRGEKVKKKNMKNMSGGCMVKKRREKIFESLMQFYKFLFIFIFHELGGLNLFSK